MKRFVSQFIVCCVALLIAGVACGQSVEIKLKDGSRWRGAVGDVVEVTFRQSGVEVPMTGTLVKVDDLYVQVKGRIGSIDTTKTIFRSDIVSVKSTGQSGAPSSGAAASSNAGGSAASAKPGGEPDPEAQVPDVEVESPVGVFVLPMEGFVGGPFRHEEIKKMGEHLDKIGPGQVLVLLINSDGGSAVESQTIAETIFDIRKRHRVIAWIHKAISAGCQTAMCCNEIYFMTEGTAGSVTTWNPGTGQSIKGEELARSIEHFERIAEQSGISLYIARAMKTNSAMCSYDKDPVTGQVTFYGDLSGEYVLSDANSNLCFNASNALHCGFSDGTADTEAELAKLLNMPKWREVDDYGRKIAKEWQNLYKKGEEELPLLFARYQYKNTSTGDPVVVLGTRIQILNDIIRWWNRCPNVCTFTGVPPKDVLEREIAQLRKQLSDIRRRR